MTIYQSTKSSPYVYMVTHKVTKQFYIGYRELNVKMNRTSDVDLPLYRTSSKYVNPRFEEFDWVILAEFDNAEAAYDFEQSLILEYWDNQLMLNRRHHVTRRFRNPGHSTETKEKLREARKRQVMKPRSEESKEKMRQAALGNTWAKGNKNNLGRRQSEEEKLKRSLANKGKTPWNKGKRKLSENL